ncbi:hypothetical protein [Tautonia rosea]|uniref:hypothetical protein n=1 Tax=Tautonia rosea TaxID=2728037 RepID=UPI0014757537|nr:hypothetical protein [Tautonia rosea]
MKTEPQPRHHHEGEPPPESLIHHDEPTMLEQWIRRMIQKGPGFWAGVVLILAGIVGGLWIAYRIGGPNQTSVAAWNELASISVAPSVAAAFGSDPNAGLPERLKGIAETHPDTAAAQWARLRAASLLLNEGSAELATSRRSAGAGKVVEADDLFNGVYRDAGENDTLKRLAALGRARSAEARMGLNADDTDHAKLDDVLALYESVIEEFPETPEAQQASNTLRRLKRSDSIAFYEALSTYEPSASAGAASGLDLPGLNLAPGASSPLEGLFGLPPGGGSPGGTIPGLEGLDLSPSIDLSTPSDAPDAPDMPAPVGLPELPPATTDEPADVPVIPAPEPAPSETPAPAPSESPVLETPRVPENPFGTPTPAPVEPDPAPETPAPVEPEPASEPEAPAPSGELPDEVFPSGGSN